MTLTNITWSKYIISDIFTIEKVKGKPAEKYGNGKVPYISTSMYNNGLVGFVNGTEEAMSKKGAISIDPINGKAFYHDYNFVGRGFSGASINLLYNNKINKYSALFLCKMIETTSSTKASYGNLFNSKRLANASIILPSNSKGEPDYEFMEKYIKDKMFLEISNIKTHCNNEINKINYRDIQNLNEKKWKKFDIKEVFPSVIRGKRLKKSDHKKGGIPYVSSTMLNNGVDGFIGNTNGKIFEDCITIANSGSVGSAFYHKYKFIGSDHITALKNNKFNKYVYLFLTIVVSRIGDKYSFNREINDFRISKERILLPVDKDDNPDYEYMEQYIKNIMFEQYSRYLQFLED